MKQLFSILLVLSVLWTSEQATAQIPKSFPEDDAGFVTVLSNYIGSNNRPEAKELSTWLKANLQMKLSAEDIKTVRATANAMLQKKVPLWPSFYNYASLLRLTALTTDLDPSVVSKNHGYLLGFLQSTDPDATKRFNTYVDYLSVHYKDKTIFQDKVKNWSADSPYKLTDENNQPVYEFPKIRLLGTTTTDTMEIRETSGKFYPMTGIWTGNEGKISWRRAGLPEDQVFASFGKYQMDLAKPEIILDTVTFTFQPYVKNTIKGRFTDKLSPSRSVAMAYPQFTSFEKVPLTLSDELKLESGLGLEGTKIFATRTSRAEGAKLSITNKKGKKILDAEANRYLITNFQQLDAENVNVQFCYIDSAPPIFHPSSTLSYNIPKRTLKITRENKLEARIPFNSQYFRMNLYVDQVEWPIDSNYADLNSTAVNAKLPTIFESFDYYVPGSEVKYQQSLEFDPLFALATYCESDGTRRLDADQVASLWRARGAKAIEPLLFKMMEDGYLYYDRETGMVSVYDKLILHSRAPREENINYDNIRISSITQGRVGRILLDRKQIQVFGAEKTKINTSANMVVNPTSDTVYISENRGLTMKGMLTAGKFNFYAKNMHFNYENYEFDLKGIDSMLIMVPTGQADSKGNPYYREINTPIKNISGRIMIDDPGNRNGRNKYSKYPYFICNDTSHVAFDKGSYGERYAPDQFKFEIYPFEFENLNTIETQNLKLKGQLLSDGIFEPFESELSIQEDFTLGLNIQTEKEMPVYGGQGAFNGQLKLNTQGFKANGYLSKKNIRFTSEDILLLPDSIYAPLSKWEGIQTADMAFPVFSSENAQLNWLPRSDSLYIKPAAETVITAYNNQAQLTGEYWILNNHFISKGNITIRESRFASDSILLKPETLQAYHTGIEIIDSGDKVFSASDASIDADFKELIVKVRSSDTAAISQLHYNALETNTKEYDWRPKANTLTFKNTDADKNTYFEFIRNRLKGLRFTTSEAVMNIPDRELLASGVSQILVADSRVIPAENKLSINQEGVINQMEHATVIFNADSSFHKVEDATVDISNLNTMRGSGKLKITTGEDSRTIEVESFVTDSMQIENPERKKEMLTRFYVKGKGLVDEEENFHLSKSLLYKGNVLFNSTNNAIELDGFAQPVFKTVPEREWFKLKQSLDLKTSALGIDSLKNEFNQPIYTGLMLDMNEFNIYPRVIQSKLTPSDRAIYAATGFMKEEPDNRTLFGKNDVLKHPKPFDALMKYNDSDGSMEVTGKFNILENIEPVKLVVNGTTNYTPKDSGLFYIQGSVALDLYMMPEIRNSLATLMQNYHSSGVILSLTNNKSHSHAISSLITDPLTVNLVTQDMETSNILNLPAAFEYNTVFNDVRLMYDPIDGTFKSLNPVSMLVFAGKPFAQKINALIEIGPRGTKDFINLYLKTASNEWFFFRYTAGELAIVTSDAQFNSTLSSMKVERRSLKSGKDIVYQISSANNALKDNFVSRMEEFMEGLLKP